MSMPLATQWTLLKISLLCCGGTVLAIVMFTPILLVEMNSTTLTSTNGDNYGNGHGNGNGNGHGNGNGDGGVMGGDGYRGGIVVGLASLLHRSRANRQSWKQFLREEEEALEEELHRDFLPQFFFNELRQPPIPQQEQEEGEDAYANTDADANADDNHDTEPTKTKATTLGRGHAGLPFDETPALVGARRATLHNCKTNDPKQEQKQQQQQQKQQQKQQHEPETETETEPYIDPDVIRNLVYWNEPQGERDRQFISPFRPKDPNKELFLTFQPDPGGWNNIRMSMEIIFVLASATGRTLVLPPRAPFYLLAHGKSGAREFGSFYDLAKLHPSVKLMSMKTFYERHGRDILDLDHDRLEGLLPTADLCVYQPKDPHFCQHIYDPLQTSGWQPPMNAIKDCLVFDRSVYEQGDSADTDADTRRRVRRFCGVERKINYYNDTWTEARLLHWQAQNLDYRLLGHFYTFAFFTDPIVDNFYKRFVRDFLHYRDEIYCAAARVVTLLRRDVAKHDRNANGNGNGGLSTMHVRRGDFQYKIVKLPAEELYRNTREIWRPDEILYIATDEKDRAFFDPIQRHHPIRMLSDYWDDADLDSVDSTFLGMIDTIVATQGRTFTGTWFSTFTGYINRMRGYAGYSMKDSWYSWPERKGVVRDYVYPKGNYVAREWPLGWIGIDGDEIIQRELDYYPDPNAHLGIVKLVGDGQDEDDDDKDKDDHDHDDNDSEKNGRPNNSHHHENAGMEPPIDEETTSKMRKSIEGMKPSTKTTPDGRTMPAWTLSDLIDAGGDDGHFNSKSMARGVSGRSSDITKAIEGGSRAHIVCDGGLNVDSLAYWNDPQGVRDLHFRSPFTIETRGGEDDDIKYISFSPDRGGWNNVRMSMEIIFVIAAATGRTLVLPPDINLYRLNADKEKKQRGFADFFPLYTDAFKSKVKIITMKEFLEREGGPDGRIPIPEEQRDTIMGASGFCENRAKSPRSCMTIFEFLEEVGMNPSFRAKDGCVVFDRNVYEGNNISAQDKESVDSFCGERKVIYWDRKFEEPVLIHFHANDKEWRLLTHFYAIIHFTDPSIDNYFKRFVRDLLHYHDRIYCAAGKIVKALQLEGVAGGFSVDAEGGGAFSAMHVRRGDFQYKKVKIPAEEWIENTKEIWKPKELLYIATDEHNKTWFAPIGDHHEIRFLDDYWDLADLSNLDPNYFGMIDTIVSSRARAFAGTWFSTFSGYINRMRGYHGMTMKNSWYSFLDRKTAMHNWTDETYGLYAFEWPSGWIGIDADVKPSKDRY